MSRTAWFLALLLCYVLKSVISGNDDKPPRTNSGLSKNAEVKRRSLPLDDAEYGALFGILNGDKTFKDWPTNQDSSLRQKVNKKWKSGQYEMKEVHDPIADEDCRQVEMNPRVTDFFLIGHVFKTLETKSASACEVNCYLENNCISYNVKPLPNGTYLCELSDSDDVAHPVNMRYREGTIYKSFKNVCFKNPCPVAKSCQTGFPRGSHRCVCRNGLMGQNCNEGPPSVQVTPDRIETVEGRDVSMTCNAAGNPLPYSVTWSKAQGPLPTSRSFINGGSLTLSNVSAQDSGSYLCAATNVWGSKSTALHLRVYSAPKFAIKPPSNATVRADESLTLHCSAWSDLTPTMSWIFNETSSLPSGVAIDSSNNLTVSFANFTHDGTYTCQASNAFSSIQTNVIIYVKYPETCTKVKVNISDVSGDYFIDPDGVLGEDPFPVFCNMTDKGGVGVTVVSHDSENRTHVDGFDPPGSYSLDIDYNPASISQLKVLTQLSTNCQQFIKYECLDSRIRRNEFSWWVSRDGEEMTYFDGASPAYDGCACGKTNSCVVSLHICNCDENRQTWRMDSGLLTNKSHLPVIQLRFGDTGSYYNQGFRPEEGYHTLGKLECYGMN